MRRNDEFNFEFRHQIAAEMAILEMYSGPLLLYVSSLLHSVSALDKSRSIFPSLSREYLRNQIMKQLQEVELPVLDYYLLHNIFRRTICDVFLIRLFRAPWCDDRSLKSC